MKWMARFISLWVVMGSCISMAASREVLELYRIEGRSGATLDQVAREFEIVKRLDASSFLVIVPVEKTSRFRAIAPGAQLVQSDINQDVEYRRNALNQIPGYRDFVAVQAAMQDLAQRYPQYAQVREYGKTKEGRSLLLLKVSQQVAQDDPAKPDVEIDAATHGDELITTEVLLTLMDELLSGADQNPRFQKMLAGTELYFIPVVSPDSFVKRARYLDGVDPNRDYSWPERTQHDSTPTIAALRQLFATQQFAGSLTLHAYGELVMYPWAYTTKSISDTAREQDFDQLTTAMATENGYQHGPISTTIYLAPGSSCDYYYWQHQTTAIAVELGEDKVPLAHQIPHIVEQSREMVWKFIEHFAG